MGSIPVWVLIKFLVLGLVMGKLSWYITNHEGKLSLPSPDDPSRVGKSSTGLPGCDYLGHVHLCQVASSTVKVQIKGKVLYLL